MQFNDPVFVLLALPGLVLGYFLLGKLGKKPAQMFLILLSLGLFGCGGWKGLALLLLSVGANALLCLLISRIPKRRKSVLILGLCFHIGLLFLFKYLNFAADTFQALLHIHVPVPQLVLPLGISFFTFQQISYLADCYKGKTQGNTWLEYLLYSTYFPKLIMGPIVRQDWLLEEFRRDQSYRPDADNLIGGIRRFVLGLFKKAVLADTFAMAAAFTTAQGATAAEVLLAMLAYTFQIYLDFSGYTDMAIGVSQMLNIRLPENFHAPYRALSIRDFWKRWHMSLTGFFTEYVYFPLGGSRKGTARLCLNTLVVFAVSGLWHGASWGFILWGIANGVLNLFDRFTEKYRRGIPRGLQWFACFACINLLWLLFQQGSVSAWLMALAGMIRPGSLALGESFLQCFVKPEMTMLFRLPGLRVLDGWLPAVAALGSYGLAFWLCLAEPAPGKKSASRWSAVATGILLVYCLTCLGGNTEFVYNNF